MNEINETFLVFSFADSAAAGQGRLRIAGWSKAFKLAFDQLSAVVEPGESGARLIVRFVFEPGEKLSYERWLDRIPNEEPFVNTEFEMVESSDPEHAALREIFTRLTVQ